MIRRLLSVVVFLVPLAGMAFAQEAPKARASDAAGAVIPRDPRAVEFFIGPEDILDIQVWKNPELSRTVPVRPDGKVSLPLVNDIQAAGSASRLHGSVGRLRTEKSQV